MKILFVDLEFDYGVKARGINTIGHLGFYQSLVKLGHDVIPFYYDSYLDSRLDQLQVDLINKAEEVKPDVIFFILFRDQFTKATLDTLKKKYKTINWFGDDTWRFDNFTSEFAPHFTYCVTTDKYSVPKYHAIGVKNVIRAQWAAIDDNLQTMEALPYEHEVTFVGGHNRYRAWFVNQLKKNGVNVECFGHGWPNGSLSNSDMIKLFRTSKINLNLSNSTSFDLRYLLSHPKNFAHTIYSKKAASQIKARNFEINYYCGFQLADYVPGLEDYYEIGRDVACYGNSEEAALLVKYYLANSIEREEIRERGMRKARQHYSYTAQLKKVMESIK